MISSSLSVIALRIYLNAAPAWQQQCSTTNTVWRLKQNVMRTAGNAWI
jgi:hypothetical protein